jgi:hypothetical protein
LKRWDVVRAAVVATASPGGIESGILALLGRQVVWLRNLLSFTIRPQVDAPQQGHFRHIEEESKPNTTGAVSLRRPNGVVETPC